MTSEDLNSEYFEYRNRNVVVGRVIGGLFAAIGVFSVFLIAFGVGWATFVDGVQAIPSGGPHSAGSFLLSLGAGIGVPIGVVWAIDLCVSPAFTRVDAEGIERSFLGRRRRFAWHEIADVYLAEHRDRYWNKFYDLRVELRSGKDHFLPGLTHLDHDDDELREIRDALVQRLPPGADAP